MSNDPIPTPQIDWRAWVQWILKIVVPWVTAGGAVASGATYYALQPAADPVPPLVVQSEFFGSVNELVMLTADTQGSLVKWKIIDLGVSLVDVSQKKATGAIGCTPGTYRAVAWTAISGEPTDLVPFKITLRAPGPLPPEPGPTPPGPVPPIPVPPTPPSKLTTDLQMCFNAETITQAAKDEQRVALIGLYQVMVRDAQKKNTDGTFKYLTTGDLVGDLQAAAAILIDVNVLVPCRKIIATEVTTALGTDPAKVLDAAMRAAAVDVFARVAKSLGEVK